MFVGIQTFDVHVSVKLWSSMVSMWDSGYNIQDNFSFSIIIFLILWLVLSLSY